MKKIKEEKKLSMAARSQVIARMYAKTITATDHRCRRKDLVENDETVVISIKKKRAVRFLKKDILQTDQEIVNFFQRAINAGSHSELMLERLTFLRLNSLQNAQWWRRQKRESMVYFIENLLQQYLHRHCKMKGKVKVLSSYATLLHPTQRGLTVYIGKIVSI